MLKLVKGAGKRSTRKSGVAKVGSRAMVMHGTAERTSGGLTKKDLKKNKQGRIVSVRASAAARKTKNLANAGITTRKGVFGAFKNGKNLASKKSSKGSKKSTKGSRKSHKGHRRSHKGHRR